MKYKPRQEENICMQITDKCKISKIKTNNPIEEKQKVEKGNGHKNKPKWKYIYEKMLSFTSNQETAN